MTITNAKVYPNLFDPNHLAFNSAVAGILQMGLIRSDHTFLTKWHVHFYISFE